MPIARRLCSIAAVALGFGLIVAGGLSAFYVAPAFHGSDRTLAGALSAVAVLAGVFLLAWLVPRLGDWCDSTDDLHIPGLDVEPKAGPPPSQR
jgi:hypothetical protein